ncbi:shikimate kinase [Kiloniella majae]|uniref:shikimate kinase n=1 Tax=Kiloniella majae TaxID=1938558 RepID=UPI0021003D4A|nr:shikimate kinase [Kiloniella majae]
MGPGGVGKTTVGTIAARRLNLPLIDLDTEFCEGINNIGQYIRNNGYEKYVIENSRLFTKQLSIQTRPSLFVLSSGFLATDTSPETLARNQKHIKQSGTSILLLPSLVPAEAAEIVSTRQMQRGLGLNPATETAKYLSRISTYQNFADHQIVSDKKPEEIAQEVCELIRSLKLG